MTAPVAVAARLATLDARIRTVVPTWAGIPTAGTPTFDTSGSTFATTLAEAAGAAGGYGLSREGTTMAVADWMAMVAPVPGARMTQAFGPTDLAIEPPGEIAGARFAHVHDGVDLAAPLGTPVQTAAAGTVEIAGRAADGAVIVQVRHADGSAALYGHLDPNLLVRVGDEVAAGQQIGAIGLTGRTTGPHLHMELTVGGSPVDPATWIAAGHLPGARGLDPLAAFDAVAGQIPYAAEIRAAALDAGVDPLLLASLVKAESGFRPDAVSWAGAQGLTQLMPATAESLGVTNPLDPAQNLAGGARYLAGNLHRYGRVDVALAAYQAGRGSVARAGGIPDSPTTRAYIDRILATWSGYLQDAGA